jgi:peptide/nickel transport system substrate-binding protein
VAKRKALIDRFQEIVAEDRPVNPLVLSRSLTTYNRKVIGHTIDATGVSGNFAGVWIKA